MDWVGRVYKGAGNLAQRAGPLSRGGEMFAFVSREGTEMRLMPMLPGDKIRDVP